MPIQYTQGSPLQWRHRRLDRSTVCCPTACQDFESDCVRFISIFIVTEGMFGCRWLPILQSGHSDNFPITWFRERLRELCRNERYGKGVWMSVFLGAFPVYDAGSTLVVLLLADPNLLEGRQRSQDGAANPDWVLPIRRSDDIDLHGVRGQGG